MTTAYADDPIRRIYVLEQRIAQLEALVAEMAAAAAIAQFEKIATV